MRAVASIEAFLRRTVEFTPDRQVFGQALFDRQNTRFRPADARAARSL